MSRVAIIGDGVLGLIGAFASRCVLWELCYVGKTPSVDVPYTGRHNLQQMTVWITEVERLASIFPCLTQLNRYALFLQPTFPSRQITTSDPERDVNCAAGVRVSSGAFFEQ